MTVDTDDVDDAGTSKELAALNEAASKGPLSALLTPAFTIWGKSLEEFAQWTTRKRKENLQSHKEAVFKHNPDQTGEPSLRELKLISQWAEKAQDVDDKDELDAALWRTVLDEILKRNNEGEYYIDIARRISRQDMKLLLKMSSWELNINELAIVRAQNLIGLGLIEADNEWRKKVQFRLLSLNRIMPFLIFLLSGITSASAFYFWKQEPYVSEFGMIGTLALGSLYFLFSSRRSPEVTSRLILSKEGEIFMANLKRYASKELLQSL